VDNDKVSSIIITDARSMPSEENPEETVIVSNQTIVLQSANGYFIKFPLAEIPEKKKAAAGVRGIKLESGDKIEDVYLIPEGADITIDYKGREVSLKKLKTAKRDGKGTKLRA
jgi:DNA gyrase subunit A